MPPVASMVAMLLVGICCTVQYLEFDPDEKSNLLGEFGFILYDWVMPIATFWAIGYLSVCVGCTFPAFSTALNGIGYFCNNPLWVLNVANVYQQLPVLQTFNGLVIGVVYPVIKSVLNGVMTMFFRYYQGRHYVSKMNAVVYVSMAAIAVCMIAMCVQEFNESVSPLFYWVWHTVWVRYSETGTPFYKLDSTQCDIIYRTFVFAVLTYAFLYERTCVDVNIVEKIGDGNDAIYCGRTICVAATLNGIVQSVEKANSIWIVGSGAFKQQPVIITDGVYKTSVGATWYQKFTQNFANSFWHHLKEAAFSSMFLAISEASFRIYGLNANALFFPFCLLFTTKRECKAILRSFLHVMTGTPGPSSVFFNFYESVGNKPANTYYDPNYYFGLLAQILVMFIAGLAFFAVLGIFVSTIPLAWEKATTSEFSKVNTQHQKTIYLQMARYAHSSKPYEKLVMAVCLYFIMSHAYIVLIYTVAVSLKCVACGQNHFVNALDKNGTFKRKLVCRNDMNLNTQPGTFEMVSVTMDIQNTGDANIHEFHSMLELFKCIPTLFRLVFRRERYGNRSKELEY